MEDQVIVVKKGSFGSFLRGVLIGAGIALLFAPRSGMETRRMISRRGVNIRDRAVDVARDTRDRAQVAFMDARNKVTDTVQGVKEGLREGSSETTKDLKRELNIMEDINNPHYNL